MVTKLFEQVKGLVQQFARLRFVPGPLLGEAQPVQCPGLAVPIADVAPDDQRLLQGGYGLIRSPPAEIGRTEVTEGIRLGVPVAQFAEDGQGLPQAFDRLVESG